MKKELSRAATRLAHRLILEEEFSPLAHLLPDMSGLVSAVDMAVARPISGNIELTVLVSVEAGGRSLEHLEALVDWLRDNAEASAGRIRGRVLVSLIFLTDQDLPLWLEAFLKSIPADKISAKVRLGTHWCSLQGDSRSFQSLNPAPGLKWYCDALASNLEPGQGEVEKHLLEREREQRLLRAWLRPGFTWITYGLIISNVGYFILQGLAVTRFESMFTLEGMEPGLAARAAEQAALEILGINNRLLVLQNGQWWRLLSSTFMHGGTWHLGFNMMALYSLGSFFERLAGPLRFLATYLVCGVLASLASMLNPPQVHSLGASGAILGLAGALMMLKWRPLQHFPPEVALRIYNSLKGSILFILVVGFALGMMDNSRLRFDNWAHVGGLVTGAFSMLIFPLKMRDNLNIRV